MEKTSGRGSEDEPAQEKEKNSSSNDRHEADSFESDQPSGLSD